MASLNINDIVVINKGTLDPDLGIDIGGWQGKITEFEVENDEQFACVELDDFTILNMADWIIKFCDEERMDMALLRVAVVNLTPAKPDEIKAHILQKAAELGSQFHDLTLEDVKLLADSNTIFKRGKDYYNSGAILHYIISNGKITAHVEGSYSNYIVHAAEGPRDIKTNCTCPYEGDICKHIVAVLLKTVNEIAKSKQLSFAELMKNGPVLISKTPNINEVNNAISTVQTRHQQTTSANDEIEIATPEPIEEIVPEIQSHLLDIFRKAKSLTPLFTRVNHRAHPMGKELFHKKAAVLNHITNTAAEFDVIEDEKLLYRVKIVNDTDSLSATKMYCTCSGSRGYGSYNTCVHQVAAVFALHKLATDNISLEQQKADTASIWESKLSNLIEGTKAVKKHPSTAAILAFCLKTNISTEKWNLKAYTIATSHFDEDILNDRAALQNAISTTFNYQTAKEISQYSAIPTNLIYGSPELNTLARLVSQANFYHTGNPLEFLLPQLRNALVFHGEPDYYGNPFLQPIIEVDPEPRKLLLNIEQDEVNIYIQPAIIDDGIEYTLTQEDTSIVNNSPLWILAKNKLLLIDGNYELLRRLLETRTITIPVEGKKRFITNYLPKLIDRAEVSGDAIANKIELSVKPVNRVYLTEDEKSIVAELSFGYNNLEIPADTSWPEKSLQYDEDRNILVTVTRNKEIEMESWRMMSEFGLKRDGERFILRQKVSPVDFLLRHLPKMQESGFEVFGEETLKNNRVNRNQPRMRMSVSSGIDWFDVTTVVSYGDIEVSLLEIRKALKHRQGYVKLPDGSMGLLPDELLAQYRMIFAMGQETEQGVRMSRTQASLLELTLRNTDVVTDEEYTKRVEQLKNFTHIENRQLPANFTGELRHYQQEGFNWLYFLHDYGFGGCLADDMGIGKTVQALVFLQYLFATGHTKSASLIVMPRSLLENWARESARFTPDLKVLIHADNDRSDSHTSFDGYQLVLTTYGIMLRDIELFKKYKFHYIVLDEAQVVKNGVSQSARAARLLHCEHRLALTGTPVENSTEELWSLFAFLNPGQLGTQNAFRDQFAIPIQRYQDEKAAQMLRALVRPFILRRTKEQVAPELPPRTERLIFCEMSAGQKKMYDQTRDKYRAELMGLIKKSGVQQAKLKVLEGLLRLRQIANDPRLVDKSYVGESSKFEAILEAMEILREEGHKALIFSQFTSMLKLLRTSMDERKWPYLYLDGKTKNRQEMVDNFQTDENIPFFLISLKAGGTGLNLTAADYVIHIDPWWNPAVERQATDRTHRIGQERPVMVYKFIAEDTVEKKILLLQEKKQALVNQIISTEAGLMKSLTPDDIAALFM